MTGFALLLLFNFAGLLLSKVAHVPLPPNVLGLILLFVSLQSGIVKLEWLEETARLLLRHMMLFFAPIIANVVVFFPLIAHQWLPIGGGLVGSTIFVLCLTGLVVARLTRAQGGFRI